MEGSELITVGELKILSPHNYQHFILQSDTNLFQLIINLISNKIRNRLAFIDSDLFKITFHRFLCVFEQVAEIKVCEISNKVWTANPPDCWKINNKHAQVFKEVASFFKNLEVLMVSSSFGQQRGSMSSLNCQLHFLNALQSRNFDRLNNFSQKPWMSSHLIATSTEAWRLDNEPSNKFEQYSIRW